MDVCNVWNWNLVEGFFSLFLSPISPSQSYFSCLPFMDKGKREFILVMRDNISFFALQVVRMEVEMTMQLLFTSVRNRLPAIHTFNISSCFLFLSKCCIREKNQSNNKKVHILSPPVTLNILHGHLFVVDYSHMVKVYRDISYSSKKNLFTYRVHIKQNL